MDMSPNNPDTAKWFVEVPDNPIKKRCICCDVLISAIGPGQWKHVNTSETHRRNQSNYELQNENERLKSVSIEVFRKHVEEQKQPLLEEIDSLKKKLYDTENRIRNEFKDELFEIEELREQIKIDQVHKLNAQKTIAELKETIKCMIELGELLI